MNVVQAWNVSTAKARLVLVTTMLIIIGHARQHLQVYNQNYYWTSYIHIIILMINVVVVVDVVEVQMMINCGQR